MGRIVFTAVAVFCVTGLSFGAEKAPTVFTRILHATELFENLSYPGRVISRLNGSVLADGDGVISKIYAPLGQRIRRKQALLRITHTDPVYQYAPMTVLSPISGIVSGLDVTEGTQVSRGQRLAYVTDPTQLKITVEIPSLDLDSLSKGMSGSFKVGERDYEVRVSGISPFVDPATGTASAELAVLKSQGLAPGVSGQVNFKANVRKGFSIPDHAVVYKGADTFVRVVEAGKAKQVAVALGRKQRGVVEITRGLSDNAVLIERSSRFIADGEEVTVAESEAKGAK